MNSEQENIGSRIFKLGLSTQLKEFPITTRAVVEAAQKYGDITEQPVIDPNRPQVNRRYTQSEVVYAITATKVLEELSQIPEGNSMREFVKVNHERLVNLLVNPLQKILANSIKRENITNRRLPEHNNQVNALELLDQFISEFKTSQEYEAQGIFQNAKNRLLIHLNVLFYLDIINCLAIRDAMKETRYSRTSMEKNE